MGFVELDPYNRLPRELIWWSLRKVPHSYIKSHRAERQSTQNRYQTNNDVWRSMLSGQKGRREQIACGGIQDAMMDKGYKYQKGTRQNPDAMGCQSIQNVNILETEKITWAWTHQEKTISQEKCWTWL